MENKGLIIGNILIGAGGIASFLYLLFGFFWENAGLAPWYLVFVIVVFLLFNAFSIKKHTITNWGIAFVIAVGSAGVIYLIHILTVT